jgi:cytochrome bd ubiquinol oxidase subunit I
METLILSRIQFAANISFHILFPTITIALGWCLLVFKLRWTATGNEAWADAYRFWVKVFALCFGLGVVSGVTMSFQFGTNWPGFMETVGNIAGPLLAYEVLTAFFLEAVFIGIMLFGFRRVPGWLHTLATLLVALGTTASAFWILALNSWMHTPAGFEMRDGQAHATDWLAVLFNPSFPWRLAHMLIASGLTVAFLIAGLSAIRMLMGDRSAGVRATLRFGALMGAVLIPVQIAVGDGHGLNTLEHQPAKIAAIEGNCETGPAKPLLLFALPDEEARENRLEIGIPYGASLILRHSTDGVVPGLNDFVAADGAVLHPPVTPVFWAFRVMVGIGFLMLALSWYATWRMVRRDPASGRRWGTERLGRPVLWAFAVMTFSGWVAVLAGWYTTEIGRQPWLVHDVLLTADAVTPVAAPMVMASLIAYLAIYAALLSAFVFVLFHLARKAARGEGDAGTGIPETAEAQVRVITPAE